MRDILGQQRTQGTHWGQQRTEYNMRDILGQQRAGEGLTDILGTAEHMRDKLETAEGVWDKLGTAEDREGC